MTPIAERVPVFDDHNLFFAALLGVASLARRCEDVVARHGTAAARTRLSAATVQEDPLLCCVLGAIALARSVQSAIDAAAADRRPASAARAATSGARSDGSLLR